MSDNPTPTRNQYRAAALAILLELDRLGYLEGTSDIRLGKLLGVERSTIWRYRQDLPQVRAAVAAIRENLDATEESDLTQALDKLRAELAAAEARRETITRRKANQ